MSTPPPAPTTQPGGAPAPQTARKQNVAACQQCHPQMASFNPKAGDDYDGDGRVEGIADEIDGLLTLLKARLEAAIAARGYRGCDRARSSGVTYKLGSRERIVVADAQGRDLGDCDGSGELEREEQAFVFPEADLLLHKAAYNHQLIIADGSRGMHNPPYAVKLLQRTLAALVGERELPRWAIRR
jgi:hypothetical protein